MSLALSDDFIAAVNLDRAIMSMRASQFREALAYLNVVIERRPNDGIARWNKAMCLLSLGDYPSGFAEFEYRWQFCDWRWGLLGADIYRTKALPQWNSEEISGKRLLLVHEAGFGDALMMLRYVPRLRSMGAKITLLALPPLKRLAQLLDIEVITEVPEDVSRFDLRCPLFSVMSALGETVETVPPAKYLDVSWLTIPRCVGIAWAGRTQSALSLDRFLGITQLGSYQLQSLQLGPVAFDVKPLPEHYDFLDTARLMGTLDHIVTVDTAAAHLAGAIGHPSTHVLLPKIRDWRWHRSDVWYPGLKFYQHDEWSKVKASLSA